MKFPEYAKYNDFVPVILLNEKVVYKAEKDSKLVESQIAAQIKELMEEMKN